jgi:hypothetical protein
MRRRRSIAKIAIAANGAKPAPAPAPTEHASQNGTVSMRVRPDSISIVGPSGVT